MVRKANKKTINKLLGKSKEPAVIDDRELKQSEMAKLLNWYNDNVTADKLKACLVMYANDKGFDVKHLCDTDAKTFGTVAKLYYRGFKLTDNDINRLDSFCKSNHREPVKEKKQQKTVAKTPTKVYDDYIENIEYGIDAILLKKEHNAIYPTKTSDISRCLKHVEKLQSELELDYKDKAYSRTEYRLLSKYFNELIALFQTTKVKAPTRKTKRSNTTIVQKVKCCLKKQSFCDKVVLPIDILGKRKMYCYDMKRNKLIVYHAIADGFTFSGTTLKNFNPDKSIEKAFSTPDKLTDVSMSGLNSLFSSINRKENKPSGRFNDETVILTYS